MVSMMPANRKAEMVCEGCYARTKWGELEIHTADAKIGRKKLTLVYYLCPQCGHLYRLYLKDRRSSQLSYELNEYREQYKASSYQRKPLARMIANKNRQLGKYMKELNDKYRGQFVAKRGPDGGLVITYVNE